MADMQIDKVGPWQIKQISFRARDAVVESAYAEGVTVGQWLEKRVFGTWASAAVAASPGVDIEQLAKLVSAADTVASSNMPHTLARALTTIIVQQVRDMRQIQRQRAAALKALAARPAPAPPGLEAPPAQVALEKSRDIKAAN